MDRYAYYFALVYLNWINHYNVIVFTLSCTTYEGLLGVCEVEEYAEGTGEVMNYLASLCPAQAMVLVCGGHTVSMVDHSGCTECFGKVARVYDGSLLQLLEGTEPHGDTVRLPSF